MRADLGMFPAHGTARRRQAAGARHLHPAALPQWRALLGYRWQEQEARVAGFSRDCRDARRAAAAADGLEASEAALRRASAMWHEAVAGWRVLAEIEAALSRLAAGRFGWCQRCGTAIAASRLTEIPQTRYCPACDQ
jgi:RNA polymerase-binding transcription factor DksA